MIAKDIMHYLRKGGITERHIKGTGRIKYVRVACPFAEIKHSNKRDQHDSFGVLVTDDESFYHCFSCKSHGSFWQLFPTVGIHRPQDRDALTAIGKEVYKEDVTKKVSGRLTRSVEAYSYDPDDFEQEDNLPDLEHMQYHFKTFEKESKEMNDYLTSRKINHSMIDKFDLRYDPNRERVVIPVYSATDDFVGMIGRSIDPEIKVKKVYNYSGTRTDFGFGRIAGMKLEDYKRLILVEGQFDLKKTYQNLVELGLHKEYGVLSVFKSVLSSYQAEWLEESGASIYCFFDHGQAGDEGWKQVQKLLKGRVPRLARILTRNPTQDSGDIDDRELSDLLNTRNGINRT